MIKVKARRIDTKDTASGARDSQDAGGTASSAEANMNDIKRRDPESKTLEEDETDASDGDMDLIQLKKKEQAYKKKRFYDSVNQEKPSGSGGAVISGSTSGSRSTASSSRAGSTAPTIWVPREGVLKSGILAEAKRRQRPIRAKEGTASGSSSTASSSGAGSTDIDPMVPRSSGAGGDTAGAEGTKKQDDESSDDSDTWGNWGKQPLLPEAEAASAWTPGAGSAASGSSGAVIISSKGVAGSNSKWKGAIFQHQSKWKGPIPKWVPKQAASGKGQSKGKWKGPIPKWGPKPPPFPPPRPDPKRMPRPKHTTPPGPPLPPEGQAAEGHAPEQLLHQHTAESAKLRWRFLAWAHMGVDVGRQD